MKNPTHTFQEINVVLQLIQESRIKGKTGVSWSSRKKKEWIFCNVCLVWKIFFICILSQCIVYWIKFQNIYMFTYQQTLLLIHFWFIFKIVESIHYILSKLFLPSAATTSLINWPCKYSLLQMADLQTFKWWLANPHLTLLESF